MKFEIMFLDQDLTELDFGRSQVQRKEFGFCNVCNCITKWNDVNLNKKVCSEECASKLWTQEFADNPDLVRKYNYLEYPEEIKNELFNLNSNSSKDILIVVHDQLKYVKQCIESIQENTDNYRLYIWDNNSNEETKNYLLSLGDKIILQSSKDNLGFIIPNNRMYENSKSDYVILLNSDTIVSKNWDLALISYLESHTDVGVVGYLGGILNANAEGERAAYGKNIDYVMGWCMCFKRQLCEILFDEENLKFAYCEDADFCLRLKERNLSCYALHASLVHHFGNKTVNQVSKEKDVSESFKQNHLYMQKRWAHILEKK